MRGNNKYDFSGWVTRNDLKCADGRTIRRDAFKDCDGKTVPLVWSHMGDSPENVLGHVLLENRDEGVYGYALTNDTEEGKRSKHLVQHGDINMFSIYANKLVQNGGDVLHGIIREVSLVLSGANPGALIDCPIIAHSDEIDETSAVIYHGIEGLDMYHEDINDSKEEEIDVKDELMHAEEEQNNSDDKTLQDVYDTLNEEQKKLVHALVGMALEENGEADDENMEHSDEDDNDDYYEEGDDVMKHNVFDNEDQERALSHAERKEFAVAVVNDMKRYGSFKESFLAHANDYGLKAHPDPEYGVEIDALFPDAKALNNEPDWIKRDTSWVSDVIRGVHHTPFTRIKSMHADLTEDEARARGYMKGKLKKEEVFTLLKRSTDPQTIYKKQKLDRDDILDITDFSVVAWLRREMRMMLEEEIARAILISDGRVPSDDDKISEDHVRSIYNDAELYTIRVQVTKGATDDETTKAIIRAMIKNRKLYKGSGNPTFFTTEDMLADMLLLEDGIGHPLYRTVQELATKIRADKIVTVPVMDGVSGANGDLVGILVNLKDYNVGADKGGEINTFEDFDIDYNQQKYLIETRISGALVKPHSAMVIELAP